MTRRSTTTGHEVPYRPPLQVTVGERVQVHRRDTTWPAFVFVTTPSGSGWVPARLLDITGTDAVVLEPYDTTELPLAAGEVVETVRDDPGSGWTWCRADDGREGWVPHRALDAT